MALDPKAPQQATKPEPKQEPQPSFADLMALIKAQGEQIAALTAKTQQIAAPAPRDMPTIPEAPPWTIKVRAVRTGFYPNRMPDGSRSMRHQRRFGRDETFGGDVFTLESASDFAGGPLGWMELESASPQKVEQTAVTTVPNRVQDPMGVPAGNPQRVIES